ncbi:acid protease [Fistulina hepatica ATCC 64428]|uniref:Acid protease n=1 Tax=Fistulina hepatica ATCC 64428 TaxID=1128425 RepID=A0A0D7A8M6_9AGAR|nr:acid protease [Fistulina hepatica ATCC 64428]
MSPAFVVRSLPFATSLAKRHAKDILARDRARAQKLIAGLSPHGPAAPRALFRRTKHHKHKAPYGRDEDSNNTDSIDVTDAAVTYTMTVGVGSPATDYTLLIDTGSSNTWIGADTSYTPTSTSTATGDTFKVTYGSGRVVGKAYLDAVTLGGDDLVITSQSIGVATRATGFSGVDGILGIGPVDLTEGTVSKTTTVPTVTDNLYSQGTIPTESIGIFFQPSTSTEEVANGELTFGGTDNADYSSDITYTSITSTSPANEYWGIDQTLAYGSTTLLTSAGIVDTGTTLFMIASDAFATYQAKTGATLDSTTGLLTVTEAQYEALESMYFTIGDTTFEFTANAQIWPRSLNSQLGGESDKIYLITADIGTTSGQGLDFINGFAFLQRFYSVFDTTNSRVGVANTKYTYATTN